MHDTESQIPEELDILVLTLQALDGHMPLFSPAQREKVFPYMRGLASYEASRPASKRPASNIVDFETAAVKSRLEKSVRQTRAAQLADAYAVYKHGVKELGDLVHYDDE
jgi:hypothetical protein